MIVVVGPLPTPENDREGMIQRIGAIDRLLEPEPRIYLEPRFDAGATQPFRLKPVRPGVQAGTPNLLDRRDVAEMLALGQRARAVVAHSIHWAQLVLPMYALGHVVTDLHGSVPEEEQLKGDREGAEWFERVERFVVARSARLLAVSQAMVSHLCSKHPGGADRYLVLPMISTVPVPPSVEKPPPPPWRAVYAGGTQAWQNVDRMLAAMKRAPPGVEMDFLTPDPAASARVSAAGLAGRVRVRSVPPPEMPASYRRAHLAFVLRDDHPVNRVACPTKLQEALAHGLLPVVQTPAIGDFVELGYRYLTVEDFEAGRLPSPEEWQASIEHNRRVFERLMQQASDGCEALRRWIASRPEPGPQDARAMDEVLLYAELLLQCGALRQSGQLAAPRKTRIERLVALAQRLRGR